MSQIDEVVERSLRSFTADVFGRTDWQGKEREAVSLFAFGHLINECNPKGVLFDKAQLGIEVRVRQPDPTRAKDRCCKDLVIWPRPGATWMDTSRLSRCLNGRPASRRFKYELDWLKHFTKAYPETTGYAVSLDKKQRNFQLSVSRVQGGKIQPPDWLVI